MMGLSLMKLVPKPGYTNGKIVYHDVENGSKIDIHALNGSGAAIRRIRGGKISMVFQEPLTALNPVYTVGSQISEVLRAHQGMSRQASRECAVQALSEVGMPGSLQRVDEYPHQLSGGMRQRAMIAMALSTKPKLLIADEPTTALDVTIQAQVLDLMKDLVSEFGMAILFITHDLGVIAQVADRVAVMYLGGIVESGPVREVLKSPAHPYTRGLINALPKLDSLDEPLTPIPGDIPSPLERPAGCVFHTRCPEVLADRCNSSVPQRIKLGHGHSASCFAIDSKEKIA